MCICPKGFDRKKVYPVLLFLHGTRLTAEDNDKQPSHGDVRYTEYAGEGHGVRAKVFADAELWKWLLAQRLDK